MLGKLRPGRPSHATVVAYLALFVALGGTAYAVNTVGSTDIIDGQVKSVDVGDNEIGSADVKDNSLNTFDVHSFLGADVVDGSLEDQDVGQGTFVGFPAVVGSVPANGCVQPSVIGIDATEDHLLLTPSYDNSDSRLIYSIKYRDVESGVLQVCNPTNAAIDDGNTDFNLLVFDAH